MIFKIPSVAGFVEVAFVYAYEPCIILSMGASVAHIHSKKNAMKLAAALIQYAQRLP